MSFTDLWQSANPDAQQDNALEPPADGVYEVALTAASAFTAKSGQPFVKTAFRDVASGYEWTVLSGFKSQGQANVTKKLCRDLGVQIDAVSSQEELDAALGALVGTYYAVTVKTNGQYKNTYVDGATGGSPAPAGDFPAPEPDPVPEATDDESIPF